MLSIEELTKQGIIANAPLDEQELAHARDILRAVCEKTRQGIAAGKGPFYAEIYDQAGVLVAAKSNSVIEDECALSHAEVNAIKAAHKHYHQYNLSAQHLTMYISAEPCMMCAGAIMWAGIERVFFCVPSREVERITGFDEGYKPDWLEAFAARGIKVYGAIEKKEGQKVLREYVITGREVYKPR